MDVAATAPAQVLEAAQTPYDRFIARMDVLARRSGRRARSWTEYEVYKAFFFDCCQDATPEQHQAAMRAAARAAGV